MYGNRHTQVGCNSLALVKMKEVGSYWVVEAMMMAGRVAKKCFEIHRFSQAEIHVLTISFGVS